jgi:hypothetical protein
LERAEVKVSVSCSRLIPATGMISCCGGAGKAGVDSGSGLSGTKTEGIGSGVGASVVSVGSFTVSVAGCGRKVIPLA